MRAMVDDGPVLADELEELWGDYRRSLVRRNRPHETESVYRKTFVAFWRWATCEGVPPDPGAVDYRIINRWVDALTTMVATRNGRPPIMIDPATGSRAPKALEASTRRILYRNVRPFFSWYAAEVETTNRSTALTRPATTVPHGSGHPPRRSARPRRDLCGTRLPRPS